MIKETVIAVSVVTMAAGAALAPSAVSAGEQPIVVASCNPCDPCGGCNPCEACLQSLQPVQSLRELGD